MKIGILLWLLIATGVAAQNPQATSPPPQSTLAPAQTSPAKSAGATTVPAADASQKPPAEQVTPGAPVEADKIHAQRKAARLYLEGVKLLKNQHPEDAWKRLQQAAALDPGNATYAQAAELARQSAVTQLVQQASRAQAGQSAGPGIHPGPDATTLLKRAQEIDPKSPEVVEHMEQLGDQAAAQGAMIGASPEPQVEAGGMVKLEPAAGKHSFHLHINSRQMIQQVFHAYGIEASVHDSVLSRQARLDLDDATFAQSAEAVGMVTHTFYEPLDPRRVVVAQDNKTYRTQFQREEMETVYLPGLTDKELTDAGDLARNLFEVQQAVPEPTRSTLTLRAPAATLAAFNRTIGALEKGRNQLDLDVKVIEIEHIVDRETGTTFFQQTGVYNLYSEINSILAQNQAAVQEIIASGLVPNANGLANQEKIILLLLAGGQLTGPPFNQGFLLFGNGISASLLTVSPATLTMSLNSSDTQVLDDIHMRLSDDETGTFKTGERYPIETSSFSSVALPAISGLSSALAAAQSQVIPQVQYEDLGLTLKATPRIMRSNEVALTIDLKIQALGGTALNNIPILDSRAVSGVLTLKAGETAALVSDLSRSELRALNGLPGVSDIPGLQDISDVSRNQDVARLLILVTPRVVRETQLQAKSPIVPIDKGAIAH